MISHGLRLLGATLLVLGGAGCADKPEPQAPPAPSPAPSAPPTAEVSEPLEPVSASSASAAVACGALDCQSFESSSAAFGIVMGNTPRILAVGEAHAQAGSRVPSATRRFTEQLLASLPKETTDLVLELMQPNTQCKKSVAKVEKQEQQVTRAQAGDNKNEFVTLAQRARARGIVPHLLAPDCDAFASVAAAGADAVSVMLRLIAKQTAQQVSALLKERPPTSMVVAYGGAMHNDLVPREGRSEWSFGPELSKTVQDQYIELDLIVPEFIQDTPVWQSLPWFSHYQAHTELRGRVTLYQPSPRSYVLIFAEAAPNAPATVPEASAAE